MKDFRTCGTSAFNTRVPAALVKQLTDLTNFRAAIVAEVRLIVRRMDRKVNKTRRINFKQV